MLTGTDPCCQPPLISSVTSETQLNHRNLRSATSPHKSLSIKSPLLRILRPHDQDLSPVIMISAGATEKYSCDPCRASKVGGHNTGPRLVLVYGDNRAHREPLELTFRQVSCSRERLICSRCATKNLSCVYSRSGVLRRHRKRRRAIRDRDELQSGPQEVSIRDKDPIESHLEDDLESTRQHLRNLSPKNNHPSLNALSTLSESCAIFTLRADRGLSRARLLRYHTFPEHLEAFGHGKLDSLLSGLDQSF